MNAVFPIALWHFHHLYLGGCTEHVLQIRHESLQTGRYIYNSHVSFSSFRFILFVGLAPGSGAPESDSPSELKPIQLG